MFIKKTRCMYMRIKWMEVINAIKEIHLKNPTYLISEPAQLFYPQLKVWVKRKTDRFSYIT